MTKKEMQKYEQDRILGKTVKKKEINITALEAKLRRKR